MSSANAVTTTYTGLGEGQIVYGTDGLYEQAMIQNTTAGPTYCIAINTPIYAGDVLNETDFAGALNPAPDELTVQALQTINRIILHTYPNDDPQYPLDGDNNQKAASVQSAIWSISNNWTLDPNEPRNDAVVLANYNKIHDWVDGDLANGELPAFAGEPQASLSVDPTTANGHKNEKAGPFTVHVADGTSKVKVTVTNGTAVDQNGDAIDPNYEYGDGEAFYLTRSSAGTASAEIAGTVAAPPGLVFKIPVDQDPRDPKTQRLVSLTEFAGESIARVTAVFDDPTTTSTPDVEGTSVTQTSGVGGSGVQVKGEQLVRPAATGAAGTLATTGINGTSMAALSMGLALVALGLTLSGLTKLRTIHAN
jgi:hypothetical protein